MVGEKSKSYGKNILVIRIAVTDGILDSSSSHLVNLAGVWTVSATHWMSSTQSMSIS